MRRLRLILLAALAVVLLPAGGAAARDGIDVRHERVTIGPHTSMVTIVTMPRPVGNRVLAPALPGGIVSQGTATVSAVSKSLSRHGTAVAINADLFEYATGQPSGLLLIDGEVYNQPQGARPALQIDAGGTLHTSRPRARGVLTLPSRQDVPFQVNVRTAAAGAVFYDRGWGPSAPSGATHAFVGRLVSARLRNAGETWAATADMRVVRARAGALAIPPEASPDELFQAAGSAGGELGRLRPGQSVGVRYRLGPLTPDVSSAIGGGPVLIHHGRIVFSVAQASREFTRGQLVPPDARTAVAQLRDGRIVFYAADLRPGMTGLTIADVAKDLKRRGAVTAMSFDSGGSTSVAINGRLLNQPSDGVERAVGNQLVYFVGDRGNRQPVAGITVGRRAAGARVPTLSYTMLRPARVSVSLRDPRGRVTVGPVRRVGVGVHPIRIPAGVALRPGRWKAVITSLAQDTTSVASFTVTRAPVRPAVATPTDVPAGGPVPAAVVSEPRATSASGEGLTWILVALGVALGLAAALAGLLARHVRRSAG
jgi:hypothetical protein